MGSAIMDCCRFADIHEFWFQADKRSDMDCVELQGYLFDDWQEWYFQVSKCSDKCSTILQERSLDDVQEQWF